MFHRAKWVILGLLVVSACALGAAGALQVSGKKSGVSETCRRVGQSSGRISQLLQIVATHPTPEAYNTLGALYGEHNHASCAIQSFQVALQLDPAAWQARYNLAIALAAQGDLHGAETELQKVLKENPNLASAHNALGLLLENTGRPDQAVGEFKAAVRIDPQLAEATLNLAQLLSAQHKYAAAIYYLKRAIGSHPPPDAVEPLQSALGVAYGQDKQEQKAIQVFRRIVAIHPASVDAHFNLATAYANQGTAPGYQSAAKEYQQVLRLDPRNQAALLSLGKAFYSLQRYDEATPVLKAYVRQAPESYEGYYNLGRVYRAAGKYQEAVGVLQHAAKLAPGNYDVRFDYGESLARVERMQEAIQELRAAEKINPQDAEAHYQLALLLNKEKQKALAQRELEKFQDLKRHDNEKVTSGNLNNQGNQLLAEGRFQDAAAIYRRALSLNPDNAQWHYNLSLALARLGDHKGEQKELETAVKLDPNMGSAHNKLGLLYLDSGKVPEAEREFKSALEIDPQNAEAQNNLGTLYARLDKDSKAEDLFHQAIQNDPHYTDAFVNLGLTLAKHGNYYEADQHFERALQLEPDNPRALTALGMLLAKLGHRRKAIETFRKVVSLQADSSKAHLNLGIALADGYDPKAALQQFSEAVRLAPDSAVAHFNRGRVLYDLDKRQQARSELETAHRLAPNYPRPLYLLAAMGSPSSRSLQLLRHLVALEPGNSAAQYLLGKNLMHIGKTAEGIAHWKIALQEDPNNSSALYNLARVLAKSHDPEAKHYLDRFQALQKSGRLNDRIHQLNNFALSAAQNHDWPLAFQQLQEAIKTCGQCQAASTLHKNLGLIYARKGDTENAIDQLNLALKEDPQNADARKALAILQKVKEEAPKAK